MTARGAVVKLLARIDWAYHRRVDERIRKACLRDGHVDDPRGHMTIRETGEVVGTRCLRCGVFYNPRQREAAPVT